MKTRRLEKLLVQVLAEHLSNPGSVPNVPEVGELAWRWFLDLHQTRTVGFTGPNPISYTEIIAYSDLEGWALEKHHVALIRALDRAYLDFANSQRTANNIQGKTVPHNSGQALNPAAFDATFG
jgi:hypothetical protein